MIGAKNYWAFFRALSIGQGWWGGIAAMDEEVRKMLARLKFSEEESKKIISQSKNVSDQKEWEAWAVG